MRSVDQVEYLVVGAGVSGLSFANWIRVEAAERHVPAPSVLILEADHEPGGYCKTVVQDGFVWDYSGHFFHFRHPEVESWLRARMPGKDIRTVEKRSFIRFAGRDIDFPFQKNIHQLPRADFIECLVDLYFAAHGSGEDGGGAGRHRHEAGGGDGRHRHEAGAGDGRYRHEDGADAGRYRSFKHMLEARFGHGISEKFLIPYNEKLYACDLDALDPDAMGRFFPHADIAAIIANMRQPDNASYNATFTYPLGGAIEYIRALLRDLPADTISCGERLVSVDLARKLARTERVGSDGAGLGGREIAFERLVSSAPLPGLLAACGLADEIPPDTFGWNRVHVFNLGFDRKGDPRPHWIYFPDREVCFYRVGYYDNIMGADRMSLYVEIGAPSGPDAAAAPTADAADAADVIGETRARVLADLERVGIVDGHELVSWHSVVLDPAYVHVTPASLAVRARLMPGLEAAGVYSVGRYGGWTYCSIEDNMIETRALARAFGPSLRAAKAP